MADETFAPRTKVNGVFRCMAWRPAKAAGGALKKGQRANNAASAQSEHVGKIIPLTGKIWGQTFRCCLAGTKLNFDLRLNFPDKACTIFLFGETHE